MTWRAESAKFRDDDVVIADRVVKNIDDDELRPTGVALEKKSSDKLANFDVRLNLRAAPRPGTERVPILIVEIEINNSKI